MFPRMAGALIKSLSGIGAKNATKIGGRTIGSFGRELASDAAIGYALYNAPGAIGSAISTGLGAADGSLVSDRLDQLEEQGTKGGNYQIKTKDKLTNFASDLASKFGIGDGAQITQESVAARKKLNDYEDFKDPFAKVGAVARKGASRGELERELQLATDADADRRREGSLAYQNTEKERIRNNAKENIAYNDARKDAALARAAADRAESNDLATAMAKLQFEQSNADRKFDYDNRVLDYEQNIRKGDRRAKILAALGGLGMMFAV